MSSSLPERLVGDLVAERPGRARVFERLGIDYCCGGRRPLADACAERGLDVETLTAVLDVLDGEPAGRDWRSAPLDELCDHIVAVHHAYLRAELPRLATLLQKCERAHARERPELTETAAAFALLRLELEHHLVDEERSLFPACRAIAAGARPDPELLDGLEHLEAEHDRAGLLLERLSVLTGGYDLGTALCNTHRAALDALAGLERDLHEHVHEENNILFPRLLALAAS